MSHRQIEKEALEGEGRDIERDFSLAYFDTHPRVQFGRILTAY